MKNLLHIFLILLISASCFSQGHFVVAWSGSGSTQMNFRVVSASIGSFPLDSGDEIAAFDGSICCGKIILSQPIVIFTDGTHALFIANETYETPPNGYTSGNAITYKFWDSSASKEYAEITAEYLDLNTGLPITPQLYTAGGTAVVRLSAAAPNNSPIANVGGDQSVIEGVIVTLDGSLSSDPDGNTLTYVWTAPAGITLSSTTAAKPTFIAPQVSINKNYTLSLIVNDGTVSSIADQVVITVQNCTPIAPTVETITQPTCELATGTVVLDGLPSPGIWSLTGTPGGTTTGTGSSYTVSSLSAGNYTFTVINPSGCISNTSEKVVITSPPSAPTPPAIGTIFQPISTTPEGSVMLNGLPASGTWILNPGNISGNGTSYTISDLIKGTYRYTVTNVFGCISPESSDIIINGLPLSDAGTNQSVFEISTVLLDGTGSSDPDNDALTYLWTAPLGIILSSGTVSKPTFTAPEVTLDTDLIFYLIVNDGSVNSSTDQVLVTVKQRNRVPAASAGDDQIVSESSVVMLDGSASSDPENDALTYLWTAPSGITLSSTTVVKPSFTAPEVGSSTNYIFSLVVNDGILNSSSDEVVVTVKQSNQVPTANAGSDQIVNEGALTILDGSSSVDPDDDQLIYNWSAPAGIILSSTTSQNPDFVAPEVHTDTYYTFSLVVNDGKLNSLDDKVIIKVEQVNKIPVANAGSDQTFYQPGLVTLNGLGSFDPDLDALSYHWTAPEGIVLSSDNSSKPTFTLPEVSVSSVYTFSLVVNDGWKNSIADQVIITLINANSNMYPYVKDSISDVSVDKQSPAQFVNLNTVFADDDPGDILNYAVSMNTNDKVVQANISGSNLTLSFSTENVGFSEITITAESNGKKIYSEFSVEVKLPTAIYPENEFSVVKIFPNPTKGHVQINFSKIPEANSWITVFDVSGKLISKIKAEEREQSIDLHENVPGMYLIKIDQKTSKTYKLILE